MDRRVAVGNKFLSARNRTEVLATLSDTHREENEMSSKFTLSVAAVLLAVSSSSVFAEKSVMIGSGSSKRAGPDIEKIVDKMIDSAVISDFDVFEDNLDLIISCRRGEYDLGEFYDSVETGQICKAVVAEMQLRLRRPAPEQKVKAAYNGLTEMLNVDYPGKSDGSSACYLNIEKVKREAIELVTNPNIVHLKKAEESYRGFKAKFTICNIPGADG